MIKNASKPILRKFGFKKFLDHIWITKYFKWCHISKFLKEVDVIYPKWCRIRDKYLKFLVFVNVRSSIKESETMNDERNYLLYGHLFMQLFDFCVNHSSSEVESAAKIAGENCCGMKNKIHTACYLLFKLILFNEMQIRCTKNNEPDTEQEAESEIVDINEILKDFDDNQINDAIDYLDSDGQFSELIDSEQLEPLTFFELNNCKDLTSLMKLLLGKDDIPKIQENNEFGFTPLHMAAAQQNVAAVQQLMSEGANANAKASTKLNGVTPVMLVARNGSFWCLKEMLTTGFNVDFGIRDEMEQTAFDYGLKGPWQLPIKGCAVAIFLMKQINLVLKGIKNFIANYIDDEQRKNLFEPKQLISLEKLCNASETLCNSK